MKLRYLLFAMLLLLTMGLCSCGNGGAGLNGSLAVTATLNGSIITATATYTNPTHTDLTGTPITFSAQAGNSAPVGLGTFNTNNSGSVSIPISVNNFNGSQTVVVIAQTGNLENFQSVNVTGRSLVVVPPPAPATAITTAAGVAVAVSLPAFDGFVTVSDPIAGDLSGHLMTIVFKSSVSADTVVMSSNTVTDSTGKAPFPGATVTLAAPAVSGTAATHMITWTVTDGKTNLSSVGTTVLTVTAN
jgi:hypothetical protein